MGKLKWVTRSVSFSCQDPPKFTQSAISASFPSAFHQLFVLPVVAYPFWGHRISGKAARLQWDLGCRLLVCSTWSSRLRLLLETRKPAHFAVRSFGHPSLGRKSDFIRLHHPKGLVYRSCLFRHPFISLSLRRFNVELQDFRSILKVVKLTFKHWQVEDVQYWPWIVELSIELLKRQLNEQITTESLEGDHNTKPSYRCLFCLHGTNRHK